MIQFIFAATKLKLGAKDAICMALSLESRDDNATAELNLPFPYANDCPLCSIRLDVEALR